MVRGYIVVSYFTLGCMVFNTLCMTVMLIKQNIWYNLKKGIDIVTQKLTGVFVNLFGIVNDDDVYENDLPTYIVPTTLVTKPSDDADRNLTDLPDSLTIEQESTINSEYRTDFVVNSYNCKSSNGMFRLRRHSIGNCSESIYHPMDKKLTNVGIMANMPKGSPRPVLPPRRLASNNLSKKFDYLSCFDLSSRRYENNDTAMYLFARKNLERILLNRSLIKTQPVQDHLNSGEDILEKSTTGPVNSTPGDPRTCITYDGFAKTSPTNKLLSKFNIERPCERKISESYEVIDFSPLPVEEVDLNDPGEELSDLSTKDGKSDERPRSLASHYLAMSSKNQPIASLGTYLKSKLFEK